MRVQASDWCAKRLGPLETSNPIAQEGYIEQIGLEGVTTSASQGLIARTEPDV